MLDSDKDKNKNKDSEFSVLIQKIDSKIDVMTQKLDSKIDVMTQKLDSKIDRVVQDLDSKIDRIGSKLFVKIVSFISSLVAGAIFVNAWLFDYKFDYTNAQHSERISKLEDVVYIKKKDIYSNQLFKALQESFESREVNMLDLDTGVNISTDRRSPRGKSQKTQSKGEKSKGQKKR